MVNFIARYEKFSNNYTQRLAWLTLCASFRINDSRGEYTIYYDAVYKNKHSKRMFKFPFIAIFKISFRLRQVRESGFKSLFFCSYIKRKSDTRRKRLRCASDTVIRYLVSGIWYLVSGILYPVSGILNLASRVE